MFLVPDLLPVQLWLCTAPFSHHVRSGKYRVSALPPLPSWPSSTLTHRQESIGAHWAAARELQEALGIAGSLVEEQSVGGPSAVPPEAGKGLLCSPV